MIKEVTEIPKPNCQAKKTPHTQYLRKSVHEDIKQGFEQKIPIFEFIGYTNAKPEYIAQLAKEESYKVCKELVYNPARTYVTKKLSKEFERIDLIKCSLPLKYSPNPIVRIKGVTLEDGIKHVYCEIDFKTAKVFKKQLLEDSRKRTQAAFDKDKIKRRYR